ncbi:MAG: thioredoxin family protein [Methylobacteriaceae bacterium]|nr:thioredoxin family protein [Methylobacteriaceae bacterium]
MFSTRFALAAAAIVIAAPAVAFDAKPYDQKSFEAAQAAGKSILVEVHADWCPTCKAQKPILGSLAKKPEFKNVTAFRVDFDGQKDALKTFAAQRQSTLIVFKGKTETGRSVGSTDAAAIEKLIASGV